MLAGDFAGMKLYKLPAQDKKLKKDGTPRDPKKRHKRPFSTHMLAGDFAGMKLYKLPAQDKKLQNDGTPRDPKKIG